VRPNYEEWQRNRRDERLAKNAVMTASIMAARVLYYWKDRDLGQVYGAQTEHEYREALAARECADFALVRDVADTHRHVEITRASRQVTRYDQTADKPTRWGAAWGSAWGGELVVTLDDGTSRPLADIMENVIAMWERPCSPA
jgi:hypothetical protein